MTTKNIVVFYHKDCIDGAMAAACAWQKYGNSAEYISIDHGDKNPLSRIKRILAPDGDGGAKKDVVFLDIAPQKEYLQQLEGLAASILILDHHATIKESLSTYVAPDHVKIITDGDQTMSGAELAHEYFVGKEKAIPPAIKWATKIDLGKLTTDEEYGTAYWIDNLPKATIGDALETFALINKCSDNTLTDFGRRKYPECKNLVDGMLDTRVDHYVDVGTGGLVKVPVIPVNPRKTPRLFDREVCRLVKMGDGYSDIAIMGHQEAGNNFHRDAKLYLSIRSCGVPAAHTVADYLVKQANELVPIGFKASGGGNPTNAQLRVSARQLAAIFQHQEIKGPKDQSAPGLSLYRHHPLIKAMTQESSSRDL